MSALEMPELLPCPFCGGEADYALGYGAACTNPTCGAGVPCRGDDFTPWNRRADLCASGQQVRALGVDDLAQIIRVVDGNNTLGAGELAEAILEAMPAPRIVGALTPAPQPEGQDALKISPEYQALFDEVKQRAQPEGQAQRLSEAIRQACDLLAERSYGSPARSPAHNARLVLEAALAHATPTAQEAVPTCFACEDNPKRPNIPCAVCGAHPPQPSETVSGLEAEEDQLIDALSGHPGWKDRAKDRLRTVQDALRALKGGER